MTFDDYQKVALTTADTNYEPLIEKTIWAMGIAGEAGEVIEKWKKIVAYKDGAISDEDLKDLAKELGDVVWYIAVFAHTLGLSFDEIINTNIAKLSDRKKRNVIRGAGDNR
jgi:NTP pyrophosphatase (non-canonical NTP hydrolase)